MEVKEKETSFPVIRIDLICSAGMVLSPPNLREEICLVPILK